MDFLHPSEAQELIHTRQHVRLRHLRKLGIGRIDQNQKCPFPAHFTIGVGNFSREGPACQLLTHHFSPVQSQIGFQTALSANTILEHLGDEARQTLRLVRTLGGFARSFFAARAASSYIVGQ